jgi:hypothetical protein
VAVLKPALLLLVVAPVLMASVPGRGAETESPGALRARYRAQAEEVRRWTEAAEEAIREGRGEEARTALGRLSAALETQRSLALRLEAALAPPPAVDLDRKVSLAFDDVPLEQALPELSEGAGAPVVLGDGADGRVRLTLVVHEMKLSAALDLVAAFADLRWTSAGGRIVLSKQ